MFKKLKYMFVKGLIQMYKMDTLAYGFLIKKRKK
tara:strand:+ start:5180 stop:5281 length:102 start_codon:yes stop_codon:yes gene_type:complete